MVFVPWGPRYWEGGRKGPCYWQDGYLFHLVNNKHHSNYCSMLWEYNEDLDEHILCLPCAYRRVEARDSREELSLICRRMGLTGQCNWAGNLQCLFAPGEGVGIHRHHPCFWPSLRHSIKTQGLCMFPIDRKMITSKNNILWCNWSISDVTTSRPGKEIRELLHRQIK